jgi:hypothetical protein
MAYLLDMLDTPVLMLYRGRKERVANGTRTRDP